MQLLLYSILRVWGTIVYLHIVGGLRAYSSAKDGPTILWFSDDSSLFTVLCQPFLARGKFFPAKQMLGMDSEL